MEEGNIPNWFSTVMAKNQAEYEQFVQKVQEKHQEFMQWMQASHEELMQKMMQQIAMTHTQNNTSTSTITKNTHKRDDLTHDASVSMTVDTKWHSYTDMENPKNFGVEKAEIDEGPSSGPLRGTSVFSGHTGSSSSTCIGSASIGIASSQSVGLSCMPVIGSSSAPVGRISTFGQKPSFREYRSPGPAQLSLVGSSFSETGSTFVSQPVCAISTSAIGSTSTPVFGTGTPIFGSMNALAYGFPSTSATGALNNPAIGIGSTPAIGQLDADFSQSTATFSGTTIPTFSNSPVFGNARSPFVSQSSALGAQSITPIFSILSFGQTPFERPLGSCRLASYTSTHDPDIRVGKLISISAMPQYKDESHEELRWEDYQLGNKGHSNPASQQIAGDNISFHSVPSLGQTTHSFESPFRLGLDGLALCLDSDMGKKFSKSLPRLGKLKRRSGRKSSFRGFGSPSPTQSSLSRSTFSQTQTTFGTQSFGASIQPAFGASIQPAFGATSTSAFGSTSTPEFSTTTTSFSVTNAPFSQTEPNFGTQTFDAFGATSTSAFGSTLTPAIGTTTKSFSVTNAPAFGALSTSACKASSNSTPPFGLSASGFGATVATTFGNSPFKSTSCQTEPAFRTQPSGVAVQPAFGATIQAFGSTSIPASGTTTTSFCPRNVPACGAPSTSASEAFRSFSFCSTPAFGLSATAFGATSAPTFGRSSTFEGNGSPFGSQGSALGAKSTTSAFIAKGFGQMPSGKLHGSGTASYTTTNEEVVDASWLLCGKLISISAMPQFKDESHEELRWADRQLGNKGIKMGRLPTGK